MSLEYARENRKETAGAIPYKNFKERLELVKIYRKMGYYISFDNQFVYYC